MSWVVQSQLSRVVFFFRIKIEKWLLKLDKIHSSICSLDRCRSAYRCTLAFRIEAKNRGGEFYRWGTGSRGNFKNGNNNFNPSTPTYCKFIMYLLEVLSRFDDDRFKRVCRVIDWYNLGEFIKIYLNQNSLKLFAAPQKITEDDLRAGSRQHFTECLILIIDWKAGMAKIIALSCNGVNRASRLWSDILCCWSILFTKFYLSLLFQKMI